MKLSVSMLAEYLYCKRKLYLNYVLRLAEIPKEVTLLGTLRHEVNDLANKKEEEIVKSIKTYNLDNIFNIYKKEYILILKNTIKKYKNELKKFNLKQKDVFERNKETLLEEAKLRAENVFNFVKKYNVFGDELWQKLTPKIHSEVRVESNILNLKGIIDKVEVYDNYCVPFELKTGKCPNEGVWPGHKIQITSYALMLEEKFKIAINEGFVYYIGSKEKRSVLINPFSKLEIKNLISNVAEVLNNNAIPGFCNNDNKCRVCGLKDKCYDVNLIEKELEKITTNQDNKNPKSLYITASNKG